MHFFHNINQSKIYTSDIESNLNVIGGMQIIRIKYEDSFQL